MIVNVFSHKNRIFYFCSPLTMGMFLSIGYSFHNKISKSVDTCKIPQAHQAVGLLKWSSGQKVRHQHISEMRLISILQKSFWSGSFHVLNLHCFTQASLYLWMYLLTIVCISSYHMMSSSWEEKSWNKSLGFPINSKPDKRSKFHSLSTRRSKGEKSKPTVVFLTSWSSQWILTWNHWPWMNQSTKLTCLMTWLGRDPMMPMLVFMSRESTCSPTMSL